MHDGRHFLRLRNGAFLKAYWLGSLAEVWDNPERPGNLQERDERRMIARALQGLTCGSGARYRISRRLSSGRTCPAPSCSAS